MSYWERIRENTRHDLSRYRPLRLRRERIGWIRVDRIERLLAFHDVFRSDGEGLALAEGLEGPEALGRAVAGVVARLEADGTLVEDCTERFPVVRALGEEPRFLLSRCAVTYFGVRAFGVHVNGYVREGNDLRVWVGRRTDKVRAEPYKLDHLVAGGQPAGMSLRENLRKEAWEEAGVPAALASRAVPAGVVTYRFEDEGGLRDEVLYVFDLELPADFRPQNHDGELGEFELWDVGRLERALSDGRDFKRNVVLVNLDLLDPEDVDYVRIAKALRR
jgi:8-oxo-dGTP pyrophosphatase MutT (NUDIX family)